MATSRIPIITVGDGVVPFPGVSLRVPLSDRPDVVAQLTHLLRNEAANPSSNGLVLGLVPVSASAVLAPSSPDLKPGRRTHTDLADYGTTVKIRAIRIDSAATATAQMLVEGMHRFKVSRIVQTDPHLSADVSFVPDLALELPNPEFESVFSELRIAARKLVMLARMSAVMPKRPPLTIQLGRQIDSFIANVPTAHAGLLADFMINIIDVSHADKLEHLADVDVISRVNRAHRLVVRELGNYESNGAGRVAETGTMVISPALGRPLADVVILPQRPPFPGRSFPAGLPGMPPGGNSEEANELDEIKRRLDSAGLPAEAAKVVQKELQRLSRMSPAQTEYHVCRTYLETVADIPWSKMTPINLDRETLTRAQAQLDSDHTGLDHVKRRLIEYLAVLRLKQSVQARLDSQVAELKKRLEANAVADSRGIESSDPPPAATEKSVDTAAIEAEIAVLEARRNAGRAPILLLVGPPGTGKTSLARSIATALGRAFHRISLGGIRDEAEIRGHRRTYVAAMPGLLVAGLRKAGVANPVMLLDEVDKLAMSNYHGDPSAALLEVLDPEQNHAFSDHYLGVPVDLSRVLFIATANSTDTIPAPLLDRMETITLSGYTPLEKRDIASRHLLPKQITANGLEADQLRLDDDVMDKLIVSYTREAGVRNLERTIGAVCRAKAVQFARALDSEEPSTTSTSSSPSSPSPAEYDPLVHVADLESILGVERFHSEIASTAARPGVVTGLVAFSSGSQGGILFIEVADMPGSGTLVLTGTLGDVLKESVEVALSWVRAHAFALGLVADPETDLVRSRNIHVHCPAGAVPKDGPSAGLAHTLALVSLFSARPIDPSIAMTGEVSLRGRVLPVGGIRDKLIGALRAGVRTVLLPAENRKDVVDLPDEVRSGLRIVHVAHVWEALQVVWPAVEWKGWDDSRL